MIALPAPSAASSARLFGRHNSHRRGAAPQVIVPLIVLTALLSYGIYYLTTKYILPPSSMHIGAGTLEVDDVELSARISGRITRVMVTEGSVVKAGDVLMYLDTKPLEWRVKQAEAALAQARANLRRLEAGYTAEEKQQAQARFEQARFTLADLRRGPTIEEREAAEAEKLALGDEHRRLVRATQRIVELELEGISTTQNKEDLEAQKDATFQRYLAATKRLDQLNAGTRSDQILAAEAKMNEAQAYLKQLETGFRVEDRDAAKAAVAAADAQLESAKLDLNDAAITAPRDGIVEDVHLLEGEFAGVGQALVRMVYSDTVHLRAFVPERYLGYLQIGDTLEVRLTAAPNLPALAGKIVSVRREGEYTPRNTQTPDERARIAYQVRVVIENQPFELRGGMGANLYLSAEQLKAIESAK